MDIQKFFGPFATVATPVAQLTWSVEAELSNIVRDTGVVSVELNRPILIVGMHPVVRVKRPLAGGGLVAPELDDVLVLFESNQSEKWTAQRTEGVSGPGYVSLSSLDLERRSLLIEPNADAPTLDFTFAWRNFDPAVTPGAPIFEHALISLDLFVQYLPKAGDR